MRYFFKYDGTKYVRIFLIALVGAGILWPAIAMGIDTPGLKLNLYTDPGHPDFKFQLDQDPIPLIIVIKNIAGTTIHTARGFSGLELYKAVIVTDPTGARHYLKQGDHSHKMPVPYFLSGRPWSLAEALPATWVRSATIDDIRDRVPIMLTTAGWYKIQAYQPFARFASTGQFPKLGTLGLLDNPANWSDTVSSNVLQIFIAPPSGAQLKVQVLDSSVAPGADPTPAQVPVRVFNSSDITAGFDLAQTWQNIDPVLTGTTDSDGWVVWPPPESVCITEGDYKVIAFYNTRYADTDIFPGTDGWAAECTGLISTTITFVADEPQPSIPGDLDGDGDVDRDDVNVILVYRNQPASVCPACDIDEDGTITVLDARKIVLMCTRPRCAVE